MNDDTTEHRHRGRKFRGKRLKTSLPRPEADIPLPPAKDADRIAKVIARAGLASRREAEAWIAAGRVAVNGKPISSPALNVGTEDRITVDGKPLPVAERTRLFLFHKPRGLVTTSADTHGRPTIFGALPKNLPRLMSVGRLDLNTEGLLLLTNDGGLARALELPATGWLRRYRVRAHGKITQARLDGLRQGIEVDGIHYGAIEATLDREQGANVWLTFAMREGKNREIRNVLGHLGLAVNRLIRVSYGPFQLGELPAGAVLEVKTRALREQLGTRIAAVAGADFSGPIVEREEAEDEAERPPHHRHEPRSKAGEAEHRKPEGRGKIESRRQFEGRDKPKGGGKYEARGTFGGKGKGRPDDRGPSSKGRGAGRRFEGRPSRDDRPGGRGGRGHRPYKGRRDR